MPVLYIRLSMKYAMCTMMNWNTRCALWWMIIC